MAVHQLVTVGKRGIVVTLAENSGWRLLQDFNCPFKDMDQAWDQSSAAVFRQSLVGQQGGKTRVSVLLVYQLAIK